MFYRTVQRFSGCRFHSYFHKIGKYPLKYITLGQLLEDTVLKFGDREALNSVHQKQKITYREVLRKSDNLAAGLLNIGLKKGDRLGLWCPNYLEWFIVHFACARAGLILVTLNPAYETPEIEYAIKKVDIKCIICPENCKRNKYYEVLNELIPNLGECDPGKINSNRVPSLKSIVTLSQNSLRGTFSYNEIEKFADENSVKNIRENQNRISPDSVFSIIFSSGTTGKPKAAMLSHFSHVNNSLDIGRRMELDTKHHKICVMVPFFHAFGITISTGSSTCYGSTLVLPSEAYSPSDNLTAIKNEKCTVLNGTPTMYLDLISEQLKRNEDISPEISLSGGSPISPHQLKTMLKVLNLKKAKNIYGLTETTAMVCTSQPGDSEETTFSTLGQIGDHMEAKVVDENGDVVPFGTPGELCMRGYQNMVGYWDDEEKTKETLGSDGWLKTGDQFVLNKDGYGQIVGRIKDMIIRGGENIFPKEVEDILITHPSITEVHVIGLPHERLGEEVCACIKLSENAQLTNEQLKDFCKGKMAYYKIPTHFKIVDKFPKTGSGKIQKFILTRQYTTK